MGLEELDLQRALDEPSYFIEEFIGVEPFDYQKEFLDADQYKRIFVAGRQVGKSRSNAWLAIWYAMTHMDAEVIMTAKAQRQSMELFNQIKKELRNSVASEDQWGVQRDTRTEINLENGSRIMCLPVGRDGSNIRGYSPDMLIVDEAAFIPEQIFQEVLTPMLAVGKNHFIVSSTPYSKSGFFFKTWRDTKNDDSWARQRVPTMANPLVEEEYIEDQKRQLTPNRFEQEVLGQFKEDSGAYFTKEEVQNNTSESVRQKSSVCYLGADLAHVGDDASVFVSIDEHGNVFDIDATREYDLNDAAGRVKTLDQQFDYTKIFIDQTGLGAGVVDNLTQDLGRKVEGITFSLPKKQTIYSTLKNEFQDEEIDFEFVSNADDHGNHLEQELTSLQHEYTRGGKLKIHHEEGGHDDYADALALANFARCQKTIAASDPGSMKPFDLSGGSQDVLDPHGTQSQSMGSRRPSSRGRSGRSRAKRRKGGRRSPGQ